MNTLLVIAAVVGVASAGVINYGGSYAYGGGVPLTYSVGHAGYDGYNGLNTIGASKTYGYSYGSQPQVIQSVPVVQQQATYAVPHTPVVQTYAAPVAHSSPVVYSNGYSGYSGLGGYTLGGSTLGSSQVLLHH